MIISHVDGIIDLGAQIPKNRLIMLSILALLYITVTAINSYSHIT